MRKEKLKLAKLVNGGVCFCLPVNFCHKLWTSTRTHTCLLISAPWTYGYLSFNYLFMSHFYFLTRETGRLFSPHVCFSFPVRLSSHYFFQQEYLFCHITISTFLNLNVISQTTSLRLLSFFIVCTFAVTSLHNPPYNKLSISSFLLSCKLRSSKYLYSKNS